MSIVSEATMRAAIVTLALLLPVSMWGQPAARAEDATKPKFQYNDPSFQAAYEASQGRIGCHSAFGARADFVVVSNAPDWTNNNGAGYPDLSVLGACVNTAGNRSWHPLDAENADYIAAIHGAAVVSIASGKPDWTNNGGAGYRDLTDTRNVAAVTWPRPASRLIVRSVSRKLP
jgi:hypothetical protein